MKNPTFSRIVSTGTVQCITALLSAATPEEVVRNIRVRLEQAHKEVKQLDWLYADLRHRIRI